MTLIALATHDDHAEVLTDTLSYTVTARTLGRATKVHTLPHLDAAVMTHGSADVGRLWALHAAERTRDGNFDSLVDGATDALRALWAGLHADYASSNARHGTARSVPRSAALAVGYSERAGRFTAHVWASEDAFARTDLERDRLFVIPAPSGVRPSELELGRLASTLTDLGGPATDVQRFLGELRAAPALSAPEHVQQWTALADVVRQHRAVQPPLDSGLKMYVGGDAILTRLERGLSSSRRVHTFHDQGAELAQMMAGSLHPLGQAGPCDCGSGARLVDCCLQLIAADPCPCGSAATFAACCSEARADRPAATATAAR